MLIAKRWAIGSTTILLATRFGQVGCFVSHNHPNYWDEDFVGELRHELQTEWISDWAERGIIDALEVWSPPFASQRVPDYWEKVLSRARTRADGGHGLSQRPRARVWGAVVENHPEIPPLIYAKLARQQLSAAREATDPWQAYSAWREVLEIDYAQQEALHQCPFARQPTGVGPSLAINRSLSFGVIQC